MIPRLPSSLKFELDWSDPSKPMRYGDFTFYPSFKKHKSGHFLENYYPNLLAGAGHGVKDINKRVCDIFGPRFAHRLWGASWDLLVNCWSPEIRKNLVVYKPFKREVSVNLSNVRKAFQYSHILKDLEKDKLEYLAHATAFQGMDTQEARAFYGKGLWKKITGCSGYKLRSVPPYAFSDGHFGVVEHLGEFLDFRAGVLKQMHLSAYNFKEILWAGKNSPTVPLYNQTLHLVCDTKRMLNQLEGEAEINHNWSFKRMREEHDKASKALTARKYSKELFSGPYVFTDPLGTTFTRLNSAYEVALEGNEMGHCVASYANRCAKGLYEVYKVESPFGRATLGLQLNGEQGYRTKTLGVLPTRVFNQCYGPRNSKVDTNIMQGVSALISKLNKEGQAI